MATRNFSVRTEDGKLEQIDAIARAQNRSRSFVVNQALDRYLAEERAWIAKVNEGLAAAEAGDFADADEVEAVFKGFEEA